MKVTMQKLNQYLDYLNDPSFQVVNRPFVLLVHIKQFAINIFFSCRNKD